MIYSYFTTKQITIMHTVMVMKKKVKGRYQKGKQQVICDQPAVHFVVRVS